MKIFIAKENLFGNNASEITKRTLRKYDEYEISYEIFGVKNKLEGKGLLEFRPKYCMWAKWFPHPQRMPPTRLNDSYPI